MGCIVSVHCQEEGCIGLCCTSDDQDMRDVPRVKPKGHLEDSRQCTAIFSFLGMYQEIHPSRANCIDSAVNQYFLVMMRECEIMAFDRDFLT